MGDIMKKSLDFSKGIRNPFGKQTKKRIVLQLDEGTITQFKLLAKELKIPYKVLISTYLRGVYLTHAKRLRAARRKRHV